MSGRETSGNPENAFIKAAVGGFVGIIVVGGIIAWAAFILGDRVKKAQAAKHLEGGWVSRDGTEFWFEFDGKTVGTVEMWTDSDSAVDRVRIAVRRGNEVVIGIGATEDRERYFMVGLTGDENRVTMRADGGDQPTMNLTRARGTPRTGK